MSLGSVLIKPQPVSIPLTAQVDVAEVLVDLAEAITRNPEGAAAAAQILLRESEGALRDFAAGFEERIRLSDGKIRQLFRPFAEALDAFVQGVERGAIVDVLAGALEAIARLLRQLRRDAVADLLRRFFDLAERDLGLSADSLRDLVTALATRVIGELKREVINGSRTRAALARYEFGCALDGLRSLVDEEEIEIAGLDADALVDVIVSLWDQTRVDRLLAWLEDLLAHRDDVLAPLAAVIEARLALRAEVTVRVTPAPVGAGATGDEIERAPAPEVSVDIAQNPDDPVAWYASWVAGKVVRFPAGDLDNPYLNGFSYAVVSAPTMEKIAFHSAWLASSFEALLHAISAEQGDFVENLVNLGFNGLDIVLVALDKPKLIENVDCIQPRCLRFAAFMATNFLTGLEGARFGDPNDPYWLTNLGGDVAEAVLYRRWFWLAREFALSTLTLLNHKRDGDGGFAGWLKERRGQVPQEVLDRAIRLHNNNCFEGFCYAWAEFGILLLPLVFAHTDRRNYGFIGGTLPAATLGKAIGGAAVSWGFLYLSIFLARVLAGEFPSDWGRYARLVFKERLYGEFKDLWFWQAPSAGEGVLLALKDLFWDLPRAAVALGMYVVDYGLYLYLFTDGETDDGTYWVDLTGAERTLPGYPPAAGSPYLLPWVAGTTQQCVQGNMGIWSHYPQNGTQAAPFNNGQMYAYDFSHDAGTEVLCSRAGIVTMACDIFPDNNPSNWNSTEILHLAVNPPAGGLAAVPPPAGVTTFFDGVTPIPAGTLFPPYWNAAGNPLPGMPNPVPLHPSAAILPGATPTAPGALPGVVPAYYAGFNGFPGGTTFAFINPAVDRALPGASFPAGVAFSDGTPIPAGTVFAPGTAAPPAPGSGFPAGTTFMPPAAAGGAFAPLLCTFCVYGHLLNGFMQISTAPASPAVPGLTQTPRPTGLADVFRSRRQNVTLGDNNTPALIPAAQRTFTTTTVPFPAAVTGAALANNNVFLNSINSSDVLGLFVAQGQPVGISGDTGVSAYNHLHTMVYAVATLRGNSPTLPFAYADATHGPEHSIREVGRRDGVPRAMTYYDSGNNRVAPT